MTIILIYSFLLHWPSFDLARHGVIISVETIYIVLFYYIILFLYFILHQKNGRIKVDALNIFIILFSSLVFPGMMLSEKTVLGFWPHWVIGISSILFVLTATLLDYIFFRFKQDVSLDVCNHIGKKTAFTSLLLVLTMVGITAVSGNMDRSGAIQLIFDLYLSSQTKLGAVAAYREEVYHSFGYREVIGNYAGSIFAPFFGLITYSYLTTKTTFGGYLIKVFVLGFPLIFAIGSGSRLMLLKLILLYFIYFHIKNGVKISSTKILKNLLFAFFVVILSTSLLGRGKQGSNYLENMVIQTEKSIARLVIGKGASSMAVFNYYPDHENFELGVPILEKFIGMEIDNKPSVAHKMYSFLSGGKVGTAGPQTFADIYASFGLHYITIFALFWVIFLYMIRIYFYRKKSISESGLVLWCYIFLCLGYTGYSDLASFKSIGLIYIVIVSIILKLFLSIGKPKQGIT